MEWSGLPWSEVQGKGKRRDFKCGGGKGGVSGCGLTEGPACLSVCLLSALDFGLGGLQRVDVCLLECFGLRGVFLEGFEGWGW